jgi:tRNA-dihydrouridine synthase
VIALRTAARRVRHVLMMQVIGNGDIFSFEDYEAHMKSGNVCSSSSSA